MLMPYVLPIVLIVGLIYTSIKILMEYERGVIFFLGKFQTVKGPGLILVLPGLQKMMRVNLQTVTMDVPAQDVITRDNVSVKVNAVIFFRVVDPERAILAVQDYLYSTSQIAQTTFEACLARASWMSCFLNAKRSMSNCNGSSINKLSPGESKSRRSRSKMWTCPQEMLRAIAKQAEAERERRAKVIHAQGEFEASQKLSEAAVILSNPTALQLRYLQTLVEVGAEKNSTIIFPIPIDIIPPCSRPSKVLLPSMENPCARKDSPAGSSTGSARQTLMPRRSFQSHLWAYSRQALCADDALATSRPAIGFIDALFTMTSAVCVTGLVVLDMPKDLTIFGQLVILAGIQLGGLGYSTMATLLLLALGRRIGLRQRMMMMEVLSTLSMEGLVQFVKIIAVITLLVEAAGSPSHRSVRL